MAFNPQDYMISLKGKDYLPVAYRIVWFKDKHGDNGAIATEVLNFEPLLVKATVLINGVIVSTGHGSAKASGNAVWSGREIEKAETAAIGRALGHAGFGTQFDEDEDLEHLADSPVEKPATPKSKQSPAQLNPQEWSAAHWDALCKQFTPEVVTAALQVKRGGQWDKSYATALAIVQKYAEANTPL